MTSTDNVLYAGEDTPYIQMLHRSAQTPLFQTFISVKTLPPFSKETVIKDHSFHEQTITKDPSFQD